MKAQVRTVAVPAEKSDFDDGKALTEIMVKSFAEAAREAVAENDRLGIATHGGAGGVVVERKPAAIKQTSGG